MIQLEKITRKMPMPIDPVTFSSKSKLLIDSLSRKQNVELHLQRETENFKRQKKALLEQITAEDVFINDTTLELRNNIVIQEADAIRCYDYDSGLQCERRADNGAILAGSVCRIDDAQTGLWDDEKVKTLASELPEEVRALCLAPVTPEEKPVPVLSDSSFDPVDSEGGMHQPAPSGDCPGPAPVTEPDPAGAPATQDPEASGPVAPTLDDLPEDPEEQGEGEPE